MSFPSTDVKPFPVADAVPSYWRKQVGPIDNHRSTEHLPAQADVVIIGAGYAGASIVHHIIEECMRCDRPIPSILILEAREACSGATGRNGTYHILCQERPAYWRRTGKRSRSTWLHSRLARSTQSKNLFGVNIVIVTSKRPGLQTSAFMKQAAIKSELTSRKSLKRISQLRKG